MSPKQRDIIRNYRKKIRSMYRRCTPWRLGYQIAYNREDVPCPYLPDSKGENMYLDGMEWGKADRSMDDALNEKYPDGYL